MASEEFALRVETRSVIGRHVKDLRRAGLIPAVVYGGEEPTAVIQVDERSLDRLLNRGGASHLINLEGDDMPKTRVLVREVQRHPVRRTLQHADFVRVSKGTRIRISVPLVALGTPPALSDGAILLQNTDSIEIECMPDDLPAEITVDVSGLEVVGQNIVAGDLMLPEGVTLTSDNLDEVLFATTIPRAMIELEAEEAAEAEEMLEEVAEEEIFEDDEQDEE